MTLQAYFVTYPVAVAFQFKFGIEFGKEGKIFVFELELQEDLFQLYQFLTICNIY